MSLKFTRYFNGISFVLVCFSGLLVLLSAVEQMVGLPILGVNFFLALFLSIALLWLFYKADKRDFVIVSFAGLLLVVVLILVSGCVIDIFWDSNAYHKVAVGHLANGWNCVWQSLEEFLAASPFPGSEYLSNDPPWVEYFPKASWYYGASVYKVFHNIEAAKSINVIMLIASFLTACNALEEVFTPRIHSLHSLQHPLLRLIQSHSTRCLHYMWMDCCQASGHLWSFRYFERKKVTGNNGWFLDSF